MPPKTPKPAKPAPASNGELSDRVLEHLKKNHKNRPKRRKTLESHLVAFAGKSGTKADVNQLIQSLRKAGRISIDEKGAVTYSL